MNKVHLIGRLAADPELRQTGSGIAVTSFTIAVDRPYFKGADRQTDWIDIVAWRNTAEFVCKYFQKGDLIIIDEGSIQTRMWEDKAGQKRKAVKIVAESVMFVPRTKSSNTDKPSPVEHESLPVENRSFSAGSDADFMPVDDDENLPF